MPCGEHGGSRRDSGTSIRRWGRHEAPPDWFPVLFPALLFTLSDPRFTSAFHRAPSAPGLARTLTAGLYINHYLCIMNHERLSEAFKALSDVHRLRALQFIAGGAPPGADCRDAVCACHVQDHLELSQPATSYHLKVLRQAGLVESEKRGRWVHYRLADEGLGILKAFLDEVDETAEARTEAVA